MLRYHQIGKRSCSSSSPEHTDPSRDWARGHLRFANLGSLCAIPPGRCWRHTRHKQRGARLRKVAYRILTRTRLRCSIPGLRRHFRGQRWDGAGRQCAIRDAEPQRICSVSSAASPLLLCKQQNLSPGKARRTWDQPQRLQRTLLFPERC